VRDRLTQRARAAGENVQLILTRYAIERLLYRLSASQHRERFVLKGAMLFSLWGPTPYRATGDLDLLGTEKLEALVSLGVANSRMNDFYDLWAISRTFAFDGLVLTKAIRATFERRGTTLPTEIPFGLSEAFAADPVKETQWRAFLRRTEISMAPEPLTQIIPSIASFLMPVLQSAAAERTTPGKWPVGGPWGD
jgi:hypothetical protein